MVKGILALAVVAAVIALGVRWVTNESTNQAPTTVRVEVPNPLGGDSDSGGSGGSGGGEILVP